MPGNVVRNGFWTFLREGESKASECGVKRKPAVEGNFSFDLPFDCLYIQVNSKFNTEMNKIKSGLGIAKFGLQSFSPLI